MNAVLEIRSANKSFPGVKALDDVSITVGQSEVVGLIGENGAGKSTLLKVLAGVYPPDSGEILFDGKPVHLRRPRDAFDRGMAMVFQEQSILPTLTIAENMFLGREGEFISAGLLNKGRMNEAAKVELDKVHLDLPPFRLCAELTFAERQMVEIAKALSLESRTGGHILILLDEPTSVLEQREIDLLFSIIRRLKDRAAFVFISHRLDEVLAISDRVYVMRDGKVVAETPAASASEKDLHQHMVGRSLHHEYYREARQTAPRSTALMEAVSLGVQNEFRDVSFTLHAGEILGIAGVIGSGREALARCLAGLQPPTSGSLHVEGRPVALRNSSQAVSNGIGYVPRERKVEGIIGGSSVAENMTLAALKEFAPGGIIRHAKERAIAADWVKRLSIKTPGTATRANSLSGGNQQKVVLSKWRIARSKVLILDHPTRGIDVGAKEDVYELIRDMTDEGLALILLADTLEEVIGLSHRILVMKDGAVTASFDALPTKKPAQLDLIPHMV